MVRHFVPARGDVVFIQFNPQQGREQAGMRPALVLSPKKYNERAGLCILCPITSQTKGYPFEVTLPRGFRTKGVILSDHVKSLDWRVRRARLVERLPKSTVEMVLSKLGLLLSSDE
jgi:mRNA interferase MazF